MSRIFGPQTTPEPRNMPPCPGCRKRFKRGDYSVLVTIGPGDDPEARAAAKAGNSYCAVAVRVHRDCADPRYIQEEP